jgi:cation transport regulator ChaC
MTDDEEITKRLVPPPHDFWVFAYGSLMWNPEFPHQEVRAARLLGYHRAFCVYSHHYRGTRERPAWSWDWIAAALASAAPTR